MKQFTLKALHINDGYTQAQEAKLLGVHASTIGKLERGKSCPSWNQVEMICKFYNVHYDQIKIYTLIRKNRIEWGGLCEIHTRK